MMITLCRSAHDENLIAASSLERLRATLPNLGSVYAFQVYFLDIQAVLLRPLDSDSSPRLSYDEAFLAELNDFLGARPDNPFALGAALLIVPRQGAFSPWGSKAQSILEDCGLLQGREARIERGLAVRFDRSLQEHEAQLAAQILCDRMTERVLFDASALETLLNPESPAPLSYLKDIEAANHSMGLGLSTAEIARLNREFAVLARAPSDAELMMFAQVNSEHCRHKVFRAAWEIDGVGVTDSLFDAIRQTGAAAIKPARSAYRDNAAVISGAVSHQIVCDPYSGLYVEREAAAHIALKAETHNHPSAISPYPGAGTGVGGEIRDEAAVGRGGASKAGFIGYSVSHLELPGFEQPWASCSERPSRLASPLEIMREAPLGGAAFANEFGRPTLCGYFRSFEQSLAEDATHAFGYHKPIVIVGGMGAVSESHVSASRQREPRDDLLLLVLGGPALRIGLGGGASSSQAAGSSDQELDFASVQRQNPEMQRRCQEVIDRCRALGEANPIVKIHDVGAGGLCNALPELAHDLGGGAQLDLRKIPLLDDSLSPLEIWCNESQERYVLAISARRLEEFGALCARERCPWAALGRADDAPRLSVYDEHFDNFPADVPMSLLFSAEAPPPMRVSRRDKPWRVEVFSSPRLPELSEAARRVLRFPAVACKRFLITIGDRSVGGLSSQDQMVGPWQVPVADVALCCADYRGVAGEAMALGERAPLALINSAAASRMAIAEAITNIAAAPIAGIGEIALSANWMAAIDVPGEPLRLRTAVLAARDLCLKLGVGVIVGKDSLSMDTRWSQSGEDGASLRRRVVSPVSLVVGAFAQAYDLRLALSPQLIDEPDTVLVFIDLGAGANRLAGSSLRQAFGGLVAAEGERCPDIEEPHRLSDFVAGMRRCIEQRLALAYHDRSDGGLFALCCEMSFAGRLGLSVRLDPLGDDPLSVLFSEECGAMLQVRRRDLDRLCACFETESLRGCVHELGALQDDDVIRFYYQGREVLAAPRRQWQLEWQELSFRLQSLRDDAECAREEQAATPRADDPGLCPKVSFDLDENPAAPYLHLSAPRVAILRQQGSNGQREMAAAFMRAGFECVDVHMSDIHQGRRSLSEFSGLAAVGGFSYGDVLGAGYGWAQGILRGARAFDEFSAFFARQESFALGVCNGCQMLSLLGDLIPGSAHWPRFTRNRSAQFEARLSLVEIAPRSSSLFLAGMEGSRLPVAVAHAEGRALWPDAGRETEGMERAVLRFVDGSGQWASNYPANPNGSPGGVTGFVSDDGRVTIMMPHPERVFRSLQHSWAPSSWGEEAPWLRMFRNARAWLGS